MRFKIFSVLLGILQVLLPGCASIMNGSNLVIQSSPSGAAVYAQVEGQKDRVKIGDTPFEITEVRLAEMLHLSAVSSQWILLNFEKSEFTPRTVLLPSNRWGEKTKIVKLDMSPVRENTDVIHEMIAHFFNAKKFAESSQFEMAHTEIDKVLELDPKSVPAINIKAGIYYLQGKMDDAKRLYRQAIGFDPTSSDAIKMLEKIQNQGGAS